MLVLDENLPDGQQQLLRKARIRFRVIVGDALAEFRSGCDHEYKAENL
jgi:hypothetical protein